MHATAHQHDTIDDILYRTRGDTTSLAACMDMNPHALRTPRLPEGMRIRLPAREAQVKPATVKLWD